MALYEKSNGLLETHVQWEDIEEEMRKVFGENAKFGENKKATCISDMKGFMSKIALIEPDWNKSQPEFPKQFVVKIPSLLPFLKVIEMFDLKGDLYSDTGIKNMESIIKLESNREIGAYKLLIAHGNGNIPITKIYGMRKFDEVNESKGFIISEYIPDIFPVALYESIPADDLIPVIKAAAQFSALGEKIREKELDFARGRDSLDILFNDLLDRSWVETTNKMIKDLLPDQYEQQVDDLISLIDQFYTNKEILLQYRIVDSGFCGVENKHLLTHCDLWSPNLLYSKSEDKFSLKAIIDFQTCSIANPALDLTRCFSSCLSTEERRERRDELINIYYETFVEALDGRPSPYNLQQLKDSYDLYFPLMASQILPSIAPFLMNTDVPEELREEMRSQAISKVVGLMEDILKLHESISERYPGFYEIE